jgi:carboxypeptidase Taq
MADASQSYNELIKHVRETVLLGSAASVLHWDERTQMPPKGAEHRANQASLLARMKHEKFTSPRIGDLLSRVEGSDLVREPESDAAVNVKDIRREYDRATKLPPSLVEELTRTEVLGQQAWAEARKRSDYKTFEPWLAKTLDLKRQVAACIGGGARRSPGLPAIDQLQGRPIGRVLTKMGCVTREQVVEALNHQNSRGGVLGKIFIDLGWVTERDVAVALAAQRGESLDAPGPSKPPYDVLLDEFEPGDTTADVKHVFEQLRGPLVELVGRINASGKRAPVELFERDYSQAAQEQFSRDAATQIGFDFDAGRLDVSLHPFCTHLGPGDTRMTTRYTEGKFGAFFGVLHETGHALYSQGLEAQHYGTPRGEYVSLGIHESQSRMYENFVGRSRSFWEFFFPRAKEAFPQALRDVTLDQWLFAQNDVRPSLIRVEADEATYNLHILLRFELEQAMVSDDLKPADVPAAWNEKMRQYLGLIPPDDARGCLQDIHWSGGAIGYFPTYTLGNMYAAQFFEQIRKDLGDVDAQFSRGQFMPLLDWLRQHIHRRGRTYTARQLVKKVTGQDLSAEPLLRHLRGKAKEFYGV